MSLRMTLLLDPEDEGWRSMDLVGEALAAQLRAFPDEVVTTREVSARIPPVGRRLPFLRPRAAFNADRVLTRFLLYPARLLRERNLADVFHVVDHSYAQLVHALPAERTGVYCHDLDAFRSLLDPVAEPRPAWFRAMARTTLQGLKKAALVFHSTQAIGEALLAANLVTPDRLVHAPYGVSPEFQRAPVEGDASAEILSALGGRPYVLHVGTSVPRKRLDVLFDVFAGLRRRHPELRLVQQNGTLTDAQQAQVDRLGIRDALLQPPKISRATLAGLYRGARLVLIPSEAEGFGLPVIEALACGTPVLASDLRTLREAGGPAALYCPVGEVSTWVEQADGLLSGAVTAPGDQVREAHLRCFTWKSHAETILGAYQRLGA